MAEPLLETNLTDVPLLNRGKVRDIYDLGDQLLIVATDRISAFDVVMPNGIPDKGRVLTQMSLFWFDFTKDIVENHLISADPAAYPARLAPHAEALAGRSMLVRRAEVMPVECVVRGYLAGSGWREYRENGTVCGIELPKGLRESDKLPEPIFTPATKAESGHDINITPEQAIEIAGEQAYREVERLSLAVYTKAGDYARDRGIILADTKFEFGRHGDGLILIDEVLTPDSSRFWPRTSTSRAGRSGASTSSRCGIIWSPRAGTRRRPPQSCLPKSSRARASATAPHSAF